MFDEKNKKLLSKAKENCLNKKSSVAGDGDFERYRGLQKIFLKQLAENLDRFFFIGTAENNRISTGYSPDFDPEVHSAIIRRNIVDLKKIFEKRKKVEFTNQNNSRGLSPLMVVLSFAKQQVRNRGFYWQCVELFTGGLYGIECDLNYQDRVGNTALHYACDVGDDELIKTLIARGAREIKNNYGFYPSSWLSDNVSKRDLAAATSRMKGLE